MWTNVKYRMVYFNMGHNDIDFANKPGKQLSSTFASDTQNKLILNAVLWLGKGNAAAPRPVPASGKPPAVSVLNYLEQISGRQTVAGIHNREPNSRPSMQTDRVARLTGRNPGLWSGALLPRALNMLQREFKGTWCSAPSLHGSRSTVNWQPLPRTLLPHQVRCDDVAPIHEVKNKDLTEGTYRGTMPSAIRRKTRKLTR